MDVKGLTIDASASLKAMPTWALRSAPASLPPSLGTGEGEGEGEGEGKGDVCRPLNGDSCQRKGGYPPIDFLV